MIAVNVNELTIFYLVFLILTGKKTYVLAIDPLFPPLHGILRALVLQFINRGKTHWIVDLCPEYRPEWEYWARTLLYNIFAETESWQNDYFDFKGAENKTSDHAFAYKHLVCGYTKKNHLSFLFIQAAIKNTDSNIKVVGLLPDSVDALEAYWQQSFSKCVKPLRVPARLINTLVMIGIQSFTLLWAISRLRIKGAPKPIFFAADYNEDPRDFRLYKEVAEGGPILLIRRHKNYKTKTHPELTGYEVCDWKDGYLTPGVCITTVATIFKDGFRLFTSFFRVPPALFFQIVSLPYRRAIIRSLFCRYHPQYFWGRDDYNVEHILRREELRRIKGTSLGLNHGYSFYSNIYPMWRYISFDQYFTFGLAQYNRYTKDTWAKDMKVVATGSFGASREDYQRIFEPKPNDISIFASSFIWDESMSAFIRDLAKRFPDRTIWLKVKSNFVNTPQGQKFINLCTDKINNVVPTQEDPFALFSKSSYVFSDPSSIIVEALQFGLASFLIDISPIQKVSLFREFPGLCLSSADEATKRIQSIENETWSYPRESFEELVDLSGNIIFDQIRKHVGLKPKKISDPLTVST
jgi:hypothetical protein